MLKTESPWLRDAPCPDYAVEGEEAYLTAQHLVNVLGLALVAAARGRWKEAEGFSEDAYVLSSRLAKTR